MFKEYVPVSEWTYIMQLINGKADIDKLSIICDKVDELSTIQESN